MMTPKLLVLGSALLLVSGVLASAEEPAPAEPTPELATVEEMTTPEEDLASAEVPAAMPDEAMPEEPAEAMPMDPMAAEVVPEDFASEEIPPEDAEWVDPAASEAALDAPGLETPEAVASAEPAEPELGSVGYDSQGRQGRIHLVIPGDTLWDVSDAYLGTPWVWPSIWQDNRDIENPHLIYPGDRIWITPWEMRKISAEEAEALLAGSPAAPELQPMLAAEEPEPVLAPQIEAVREEAPTFVVSGREMVGFVTPETVEAAASIVSSVVKNKVMLSQEDRVYIGLGEDDAERDEDFTIFRVQEKVYDPETGRMLGYHVHLLGWLEVAEVNAETSMAVIRESTLDIELGDRIMRRKQPVEEISVQPSPSDVSGQISFLAEQRTQVGTMEFVYLNRGTLDGIEVGSPLEVYRRGFMARETSRGGERVEVPDRVVADLLVVKAEPEVSVALIRHTEEELSLGDRFRGRD